MRLLRNQKGFTLIEMMIVLAIISLLLLIVIPNMTKSHEVASGKTCEATIKLLQSQVAAYESEKGVLPTNLSALKDEGYVDEVTCPGNTALTLNTDGKVIKVGGDSGTASSTD